MQISTVDSINQIKKFCCDNFTDKNPFISYDFFELLEKKNVFPSSIIAKDLIFFPIEVDEEKNEIFLFSESQLFKNWNLKN